MNEIDARLAALSHRQRELLKSRMKKSREISARRDVPPRQSPVEANLPSFQTRSSSGLSGKAESGKEMDFSLYFFSDGGSKAAEDKYQLLLECTKFADRNGFHAVWTPERHFQDFGGFYPNPSVLSAALAMITDHIRIRAGSVALPLHNPIRVAEEWAVVDNLSNGRIGISFASGWHPHDFVLSPDKYENRRDVMFSDIEVVRRLWAGEAVKFQGVDGHEVEVKTLPLPVQPRLPVWVTTSSSLETWIKAGEIGANMFASLTSYSFAELTRRISLYRESLARHGHDPQAGKVTLMLHTHVGDDEDAIKEKVRPSLTNYLCSHMKQSTHVMNVCADAEIKDMNVITSSAFEHFFATSSLLGTPSKCSHLLERLLGIGVDEAACLIDFGMDVDSVMEGLHHLNALKNSFNRRPSPDSSNRPAQYAHAR